MTSQVTIVLRLILRRVNDDLSIHEFIDLNFTDDNGNIDENLSVYLVQPLGRDILQIKAEHTAFSEVDPAVKGAIDITALSSAAMTADPDGGCFKFRNDSHCILAINTKDALQIVNSFYSNKTGRSWKSARSQIKDYGTKMYASGDPEWVAAAAQCAKVREWVTKRPNPQAVLVAQRT